jgi:putative acetyltransferase
MKRIEATLPEDFEMAKTLFNEYAQWLNIDLGFQDFNKELAALTSMYSRPKGVLFIVHNNDEPIACVGVRPIDENIAELKRMYVRPAYRGVGIAQDLLDASLGFAKDAGYDAIRLDTLDTMHPAMNLYEKNGFVKIPAYYFNPEENAVYYEKGLRS